MLVFQLPHVYVTIPNEQTILSWAPILQGLCLKLLEQLLPPPHSWAMSSWTLTEQGKEGEEGSWEGSGEAVGRKGASHKGSRGQEERQRGNTGERWRSRKGSFHRGRLKFEFPKAYVLNAWVSRGAGHYRGEEMTTLCGPVRDLVSAPGFRKHEVEHKIHITSNRMTSIQKHLW